MFKGSMPMMRNVFLSKPLAQHLSTFRAFNFGGIGFYTGWFINYAMTTDCKF